MPITHLLCESFHQDLNPSESKVRTVRSTIHVSESEVPSTTQQLHTITTTAHSLKNGLVLNPLPEFPKQSSEKLVLIDTDAGTDDAWAIFMALAAQRDAASPGFKIVGITTVYGNTPVNNVANNVTRILDIVKDTTIPIYKGMDSSMVGTFQHIQDPAYNGHDGFGDANLTPIPTRTKPQHSVDAIINFARANQGQLTIICIGPLTNLAMAVKICPEIKNWIKEIYILGGNIDGVGNVTVSSEFNFFVDPEAAHEVLENFSPCHLIILPWETCTKFATSSHDWRTNVLGNMRTQEIDLLNKIEAKILGTYTDNWIVSDAVLAACVINPNVVKKTERFHCTVELQRSLTRGMMIVDRSFMHQKPANASIITKLDQSLYESMLIWAAGGPGYKALSSNFS